MLTESLKVTHQTLCTIKLYRRRMNEYYTVPQKKSKNSDLRPFAFYFFYKTVSILNLSPIHINEKKNDPKSEKAKYPKVT